MVCISKAQREITTWEDLTIYFNDTFSFVDVDLVNHSTLWHIHDVILEIILVPFLEESHEIPVMQSMMDCYNITRGPDDGDDLRNINIPESEGS